jgi:cell division protein FtsA
VNNPVQEGGDKVSKKGQSNLVAGLDIGTTKTCVVIGEVNGNGEVDVIGFGCKPSKGLRRGVVVNIDSTVESIRGAMKEAQDMAGVTVESVYAGIAGSHIESFNNRGMVPISSRDREVRLDDVRQVVEAASAVNIPLDQQIIHVLPQEFIVDNQDGVKEPVGMSGVRLEAEVHIVTGAVTSIQNIIKSVEKAGLEVEDIVLEQLASSEASLCADEKELGTVLVDIGGGTTDLAIFVDGSVVHTAVLSLGGDHFTNDISVGLRTPVAEAEAIKRRYGCALASMVPEGESIEVPSVGGRPSRQLSRQVLCEVIESRAEEIFALIEQQLTNSGYRHLVAGGMVLTGGAAVMEGMPELAEQILGLPIRRGYPQKIGGLVDVVNSPLYATGVGLALYGAKNGGQYSRWGSKNGRGLLQRLTQQMRDWMGGLLA